MSEMTREQLNAMAIKSDLLKHVLETWNLKNLNSETVRLNPVFLIIKKSFRHDSEEGPIRETKTDIIWWCMIIQEAHSNCLQLSVFQSFQIMDISRSGYCKLLIRQNLDTTENTKNAVLIDEIRDIPLAFLG
jgi:hypothetical protein